VEQDLGVNPDVQQCRLDQAIAPNLIFRILGASIERRPQRRSGQGDVAGFVEQVAGIFQLRGIDEQPPAADRNCG
jgi:hypothetical protein